MTLPNDPIRQWIIGVLLVIVSALSSVAYAAVNTRITNLEAGEKLSNLTVAALATQIAVLKAVADTTKDAVDRVESRQEETIRQLEILLRNGREASVWRNQAGAQADANSRRWNSLIDQQPKPKKKD